MPNSVNLNPTNTKSSVIAKLKGQYEWTQRDLGGKPSFKTNLQTRENYGMSQYLLSNAQRTYKDK